MKLVFTPPFTIKFFNTLDALTTTVIGSFSYIFFLKEKKKNYV